MRIPEIIKEKIHKKNIEEIFWLVSGQVVSILLGFVSIKLLTSMGSSDYGKYSLVLTVAALISAIFYGPAEQGFVRFYYDFLKKGQAKTYINLFNGFLLKTGYYGLCIVLVISIFSLLFKTELSAVSIVFMGTYVLLFTTSNIYNSMLNLLRKRKTNTMLQLVEKLLIILALSIVVYLSTLSSKNVFIVISFALIIVLFLKIKVINHYVPEDESDHNSKETKRIIKHTISKFSIPFVIWGVAGWLQLNSERWIIASYLTTSDVGIYAVMISLANYMISLPSGIISQFATPIIYERESHKENNGLNSVKYIVFFNIVLVLFMMLLSVLFGRQIILFASNSDFCVYWYLLPIICVGIGLFQIGQGLTNVGMLLNKPNIYLFPKIASGILALILNITFINIFGIIGIAISLCLTNFVYLLLVFLTNRKILLVKNIEG
jgi:O-antigen/teichoic acid export membrane protein